MFNWFKNLFRLADARPANAPKLCNIREQVVNDFVLGLQIQFEVVNDGTTRLRFFGEGCETGNREIVFDKDGMECGSGTYCGEEPPKPSWPIELD